jgi:conjugal transfer pilus assembly protein TraF
MQYRTLMVLTFFLYTAVSQATDPDFYKDKERGWFWKEDPVKKEKDEKQSPPLIAPQVNSPNEKIPLDTKWLKENLETIMYRAMDNPTEENLASFAWAQRLMLDMGSRFSSKMSDFMLGEELLDENNRRPTSTFALNQFKTEQNSAVADVLSKVQANTQGIWFFYASSCPYCKKMIPVIQRLKQDHGIDVLAISLDGGVIEGMEGIDVVVDYGQEVADRFGVSITPTTYLVLQDNKIARVADGLRSLPELEQKLLRTARQESIISKEDYEKTRNVNELNIYNNENGQLIVDKVRLENDPAYLAETLRQRLSDVQPYGTQRLSPIRLQENPAKK